jgi:glycerophosphoryl diester phosphodiesterase
VPPLRLAHRGHRAAGPENSLRSVVAAFREADGAEVDVLVTADGRAVLRHDDRLPSGAPVRSLGLDEARRLLAATADDLPEVGEVLAALDAVPGEAKRLNLELKVPGAARALAPLRPRLGRVVFTSFFATEVQDAIALFPGVPVGLLAAHDSFRFVPAGASFLAIRHAVLPEVRARLPDVPLYAWTVNDEAAAERARAAGCAAVIGDDAAALLRWFPA